MELTSFHLVGISVTLLSVIGIGIYSGKKVYSAVDFSISGRKAGPFLVMGTILGTLIGGASTIGTAQMAYLFGFSAWWFTLGGGLGCLLIAVFLVKPMRETSFETIPSFIAAGYGNTAGMMAAIFVSISMFLNIVPQLFSSMALLSSMFPFDLRPAAAGTALLIVVYVIFGGIWSTGMLGITKIILTVLCLVTAGLTALILGGGPGEFYSFFPPHPWFNLFGRGVNTDLASAFSLIIGLLSSQIYFQGVFAGRSLPAARHGLLLSSILGPIIGLGGIMVGLFMRMNYPDIIAAQALPLFIIYHLPPLIAGIFLATLLLVTIGTGAGLTLGVGTILNRYILPKLWKNMADRHMLLTLRFTIVILMCLALSIVFLAGENILILNWGYISLGVRGSAISFPLLTAILCKRTISHKLGTAAVIAGPSIVIGGLLFSWKLNPLYPGLAVSFLILFIGYLKSGRTY